MNSKIFKLVIDNLEEALNLPKYEDVTSNLNEQTTFEEMGITPVKFEKFKEDILETMEFKVCKDTLGRHNCICSRSIRYQIL